MKIKAEQSLGRRIGLGLAASSGSLAMAFPAARELGPAPVILSLLAAAVLGGGVWAVMRALKARDAHASNSAGDGSAVAETLACQ